MALTGMKILIIEVDSALEAIALRAAAEFWCADVSVIWVGNSAQIVDALSNAAAFDLVIICSHGDHRGLLLPDLADELKPNYPFADVINAAAFASFVNLNGGTVLNTACAMGTAELADAFLSNGANAYVAAPDYPDADITLLYALTFVFNLGASGGDPRQAHEAADTAIARTQSSENRFRLFT